MTFFFLFLSFCCLQRLLGGFDRCGGAIARWFRRCVPHPHLTALVCANCWLLLYYFEPECKMQLAFLPSASSCGFLAFSWCCLNVCGLFLLFSREVEVQEVNQQGLFAFSEMLSEAVVSWAWQKHSLKGCSNIWKLNFKKYFRNHSEASDFLQSLSRFFRLSASIWQGLAKIILKLALQIFLELVKY